MPIRSLDSILADEPSVHTLPVSAESDSPSEPTADTAEVETSTSTAPVQAKTKAGAKPSTVTVAADDADDEGDPEPSDRSVEGLRTALTAVRGDKRKLKKQWKETEKRAEDASRRIAHLEGQIAALSQRGAQKPDDKQPAKRERPDFFGDPEAHISARESELREELRAEQFKRDATRSEKAMRRQHPDYDDAKAAFLAEVQRKPYIWQQVADDPDPAEVVYEEGRKLLGGGEASDEVAQLKARIAELEAAPASSGTSPKPTRPPIHKSNAAARGTGNGAQKTWQGPRRFEELFPG